jgi:hypothetical protein
MMQMFNRKRWINRYVLLTVYFLISLTEAQNTSMISGYIKDGASKDVLAGANVQILGTAQGASSDELGYFEIRNVAVGSYRLEFSYVGYVSEIRTDIIVRANKPATVNVELKEQSFKSEEIVVTAGYFPEEKSTQPSVIGLQREEIRRFPGGFEDVVRTVSILPGVSINTAGGRNDLLVRGGGPSENLYIINNMEAPNINHFNSQGSSSGSLSFINLDFVDNVAFSTGGFSARYGEKMSSILSLELAEGRTDRLGGKALVSATQFGLNLEGPITQNGNFIFSARKSYLDLIFKAAGLPFVPVYTDFNLIANYNISPGNQLSIIGLAALDNVDRNLDTPENRAKNTRLLDNSQNQFISGMNYRRIHENGYADLTFNANLYHYRFSQADSAQNEYFNSKANEREYVLKGQRFRRMTDDIDVLFGFSARALHNENTTTFADTIYDRNGRRTPLTQIGAKKENRIDKWTQSYAAFLEVDWDIIQQINLNLGLRYNYYQALSAPNYLAPRAGLKYQLTPILAFKLNYGHYWQAPANVWLVNPKNRDLKALKNEMSILGIDYLLREDIRLTVEGYYKKYSNLPTGTLAGVNDYLVTSNTGSGYGGREDNFQSFGYFDLVSEGAGEAYGLEIMLQKRFSHIPLYGKLSLSMGKSEVTAYNGKTYPALFDQRYIFNLSAGYKLNNNWEISGKFRFFSGIPYTPVYRPAENSSNPGYIQNLPDEYLSDRLGDGHHLDLRVDRYFNFKNWTFIAFIDIQNVYNYKIPIRPQYDFWEDKISTSSSIGVLPSIGLSAEL